jgi:superfamily II RNA helicase
MAITLTEEEKQLVKEGKLNPADILEHRKIHPVQDTTVNQGELESIKNQIRETNILYKSAIQKNKDLYNELVENRKVKEEIRNKITALRNKKKELLGNKGLVL